MTPDNHGNKNMTAHTLHDGDDMPNDATLPTPDQGATHNGARLYDRLHEALAHHPVLALPQRAVMAVGAYILSRQPRLWPTVMMVAGAVMLLGLGTWQMIRLQEKNELLRMIAVQMVEAPAIVDGSFTRDDAAWQGLHYHPVMLRGRFLPLHQFKVAPRTYEGQVGYQLIMPMELENHEIVMVNRGFVPDGVAILPATNDVVSLVGVARVAEVAKPNYMPENIPSRGSWSWLDIRAMGHEIGVKNVAPIVVYESRDPQRDTYPIGGHVPLPSHNRHWHYAVTWYCLALAWIGVWIMASGPVKPEESKKATENAENMDPVARRGMYPEATD